MEKKQLIAAVTAVAIASLAIACGLAALMVSRSVEQFEVLESRFGYGATLPKAYEARDLSLRLSGKVLAMDDDRDLRRALLAFRKSQEEFYLPELRIVASLSLHRYLLEEQGSLEHRSVAWDLIGILALEDAVLMFEMQDSEKAKQFVTESLEAFRSAIALNSANADAKRHLELLLTLIESGQLPSPAQGNPNNGEGGNPEDGTDPNDGAGYNPPGTGY